MHLFTEDIDKTIAWWRDMLGGKVAFDGDFGGARNVFMRVGSGRIDWRALETAEWLRPAGAP